MLSTARVNSFESGMDVVRAFGQRTTKTHTHLYRISTVEFLFRCPRSMVAYSTFFSIFVPLFSFHRRHNEGLMKNGVRQKTRRFHTTAETHFIIIFIIQPYVDVLCVKDYPSILDVKKIRCVCNIHTGTVMRPNCITNTMPWVILSKF